MTRSSVLARGTSVAGRQREVWRGSFERATASAMAIQKGWMAEEFSGVESLLAPLAEADRAVDFRLDPAWHYRDWLAGVFREGGNIAPIWSRADGADTAVVALTWVDEYQGVFVRADSSLYDLGDLKGTRLGLPLHKDLSGFQGAVALRGLVTTLELAGIKPKLVTFIDTADPSGAGLLGGGARYAQKGQETVQENGQENGQENVQNGQIAALLAGDVDAIYLRSRAGSQAGGDGRLRELINLNGHPDPLSRINNATLRPLTVDRAFLHAHPDLVVRYLTVLVRTAAWAEYHHDEVVQLLSSDGPGQRPGDARDVVAVYGPDVHRAFTPALTAAYIRGLEEQKNFLRDWNFLTADFSITNWIVPEPLAEARRRALSQPPLIDADADADVDVDDRLFSADSPSRGASVAVDPFLRERGW